jgi:hypothetical protein
MTEEQCARLMLTGDLVDAAWRPISPNFCHASRAFGSNTWERIRGGPVEDDAEPFTFKTTEPYKLAKREWWRRLVGPHPFC